MSETTYTCESCGEPLMACEDIHGRSYQCTDHSCLQVYDAAEVEGADDCVPAQPSPRHSGSPGMSEIKHTPGPWGYDGVYDSSCGSPCTPDGCHDSHFSGCWQVDGPEVLEWPGEHLYQNEADARLIAAAPELLEACKLVQGTADRATAYEAVNAAIAKAEGRE